MTLAIPPPQGVKGNSLPSLPRGAPLSARGIGFSCVHAPNLIEILVAPAPLAFCRSPQALGAIGQPVGQALHVGPQASVFRFQVSLLFSTSFNAALSFPRPAISPLLCYALLEHWTVNRPSYNGISAKVNPRGVILYAGFALLIVHRLGTFANVLVHKLTPV